MILKGDCLDILEDLPPESVDALVTDPPAGIAFMGKDWDKDKGGRDQWISWMTQVMAQCMRVMKPGAHGLIWALPRTSHWTAMALEDAGFTIRDVVMHVFGSGFPKSHDISKAIDKAAGVERPKGKLKFKGGTQLGVINDDGWTPKNVYEDTPATPESKQWEGWGTALKPAAEHWILIRKPLSEKTVAKNVLTHGTGGLNIDGCRVEGKLEGDPNRFNKTDGGWGVAKFHDAPKVRNEGRFPSNFICSGEARDMLDEQSGVEASRYFYCAKASKAERNAGCEGMEEKELARSNSSQAGNEHKGSGYNKIQKLTNTHPTVKPQKLMKYLITMITPPGGKVLDPFTGSGSTGVAAVSLGFDFLGIEQSKEYVEIALNRIEYAKSEAEGQISFL